MAGLGVGFSLAALLGLRPTAQAEPWALADIFATRDCFTALELVDDTTECARRFDEALRRRPRTTTAFAGADYILAPAGTLRTYRREYRNGEPDFTMAERVESVAFLDETHLLVESQTAGGESGGFTTYKISGRTGEVEFLGIRSGRMVYKCHEGDVFLSALPNVGRRWNSPGCWITDALSDAFHPGEHKSVYPGGVGTSPVVRWSYELIPVKGAVKTPAGEFHRAVARKSWFESWDPGKQWIEDYFAPGVGRILTAQFEGGRLAWIERLQSVIHPPAEPSDATAAAQTEPPSSE